MTLGPPGSSSALGAALQAGSNRPRLPPQLLQQVYALDQQGAALLAQRQQALLAGVAGLQAYSAALRLVLGSRYSWSSHHFSWDSALGIAQDAHSDQVCQLSSFNYTQTYAVVFDTVGAVPVVVGTDVSEVHIRGSCWTPVQVHQHNEMVLSLRKWECLSSMLVMIVAADRHWAGVQRCLCCSCEVRSELRLPLHSNTRDEVALLLIVHEQLQAGVNIEN